MPRRPQGADKAAIEAKTEGADGRQPEARREGTPRRRRAAGKAAARRVPWRPEAAAQGGQAGLDDNVVDAEFKEVKKVTDPACRPVNPTPPPRWPTRGRRAALRTS